jgi:ATP-dependent DNA ligase
MLGPRGTRNQKGLRQIAIAFSYRHSVAEYSPGRVRAVPPHACKMGLEGIVSKRLGSPYRSGRSRHWVKMKNPACAAVKREAEENWGKDRRR